MSTANMDLMGSVQILPALIDSLERADEPSPDNPRYINGHLRNELQQAAAISLTPGRPVYRSPFRYPGGKNWFVRYVVAWLESLPTRPTEFVEPFAGGGSVALAVAFQELADCVTMVELDEAVAAVWNLIINDDNGAEWLAIQIATFDPTPESVDALLVGPVLSGREAALRTIVRNRTNRGGILARRAGRLKDGEQRADGTKKGLRARWYPTTLKQRVLDIARQRDKITFIAGDGLEVLRQKAMQSSTVYFIDPPYIVGGRRLYTHFELDHEELFGTVARLNGDFLMTYDDVPEVRDLVSTHNFDLQPVMVKTTHHTSKQELVIGRDLSWFRNLLSV